MNQKRCEKCRHWKPVLGPWNPKGFRPDLHTGFCSAFKKLTEWNAGTVWQVRNIIRSCDGFSKP
jgi:hypothetical protein